VNPVRSYDRTVAETPQKRLRLLVSDYSSRSLIRWKAPGYRVGCRRRSLDELSLRLLPLSIDSASVRHPARFPATSLKFRTAGFPGCGFKRRLHPESASASRGSKAPAYPPPLPRVGSDLRVSLQGRRPRAEALATTASTMSRPPVLSSPRVMLSPRSSVRRPDQPGLAPLPDFTVYAYTGSPAFRGRSRRAPSPSLLCQDILDTMPSPIRRKDHPVHFPIASRMLPVFALRHGARLLLHSR